MTSTLRLTVAQALVRFLAAQYTRRDGVRRRLIAGTWGIFGHGNVAGIGQALVEYAAAMPFQQGRSEQAMVHAAVGYARQSNRLSAMAVTTSIGPGATNLVTVSHLPVLLLPGDVLATRPADPVLQQREVPYAGDVSVNDCLRPVSRFFDRITRPEALIPAALGAMRVLTDPVETGAVTLALPQDVQAEAGEWPQEFFAEREWTVRRPAVGPAEPAAAAGSLPGDLHKLWRARSRDQYHVEYGCSCPGYEIPAAIGVSTAAPGRPVWALVGDGTYLMASAEPVTTV